MRVLVGFVAWSLIEIALFVTVGSWIGLLGTMAIVLGSGVAGVMLLRWQGTHAGAVLKSNMVALRDPVSPLAHSGLIGLAAVLLILPGFLTDILGAVLVLPPVRAFIIGQVGVRLRAAAFDRAAGVLRPAHDDVIEATAVEEPHKPSGWTKP